METKEISSPGILKKSLNRRRHLPYDCLETVTPQGDGPHNMEVPSVTSRRYPEAALGKVPILCRNRPAIPFAPAEPDIKPAVAGIPGKSDEIGHGIDVSRTRLSLRLPRRAAPPCQGRSGKRAATKRRVATQDLGRNYGKGSLEHTRPAHACYL